MLNNRFKRGMHIKFGGREYSIEQRLFSGDLQIKDVTTGECKSKTETELVDALFEGQLEFLGDGKSNTLAQREAVKSLVEDINMLADDDPKKKDAKRKYAYIKKIKDGNLVRFNQPTLEPLIREVYEELRDRKKPHWTTVYYRWFVPFMKSGEDIRGLVPDFKSRGDRSPKFYGSRNHKGKKITRREKEKAKEVAEVIQEVIDEEFLKSQRLSVQAAYDIVEIRIAEINRFRDADDQLPVPHKSGVYNIVSKLDEYEKDLARYGKKYAEHKHRSNNQGPRPTRPLERVEIDHTSYDLLIIDPETLLPLGRPTLTLAADRYSRANLGFYVSFEPPSYLSVMQCLLHTVKPKTYLKSLYPNVENDWDTYGIPEEIVVDNGPEFHSKDFEDACLQLGSGVLYSPPRMPKYKGMIERQIGTVNRQLTHRLPGTTFSNIFDRKDYDPAKTAIFTFDELMEILHIWIVDIYHQRVHRGLKDIPARVWKEGIIRFPPALPQRREDLRILLGHVEHRTIGPSGIELFTLFYNCEDLALLRRRIDGSRVTLKLDPEDLSIIYVYDNRRDIYIPVPAVDQEYTKGLRLWQHNVIKNYARRFVHSHVDIEALRRAKGRIQEIVDRGWTEKHRSRSKTKMSRWKGIGQIDYSAAVQPKDRQDEGLTQRDRPLLLVNPVPLPWQGISDFNSLSPKQDSEWEGNDDGLGANDCEHSSMSERVGKDKAADSQIPQVKDTDLLKDSMTHDELDMTGFNASFDLPRRES